MIGPMPVPFRVHGGAGLHGVSDAPARVAHTSLTLCPGLLHGDAATFDRLKARKEPKSCRRKLCAPYVGCHPAQSPAFHGMLHFHEEVTAFIRKENRSSGSWPGSVSVLASFSWCALLVSLVRLLYFLGGASQTACPCPAQSWQLTLELLNDVVGGAGCGEKQHAPEVVRLFLRPRGNDLGCRGVSDAKSMRWLDHSFKKLKTTLLYVL